MRGYCGFMEALMVRVARKLKNNAANQLLFCWCAGAFCFVMFCIPPFFGDTVDGSEILLTTWNVFINLLMG